MKHQQRSDLFRLLNNIVLKNVDLFSLNFATIGRMQKSKKINTIIHIQGLCKAKSSKIRILNLATTTEVYININLYFTS